MNVSPVLWGNSALTPPYQVNITEVFFNSLSHRLQGKKLIRRNYQPPTPRCNYEHLTALQSLKAQTIEEEREMETNIQMFRSAIAPQQTRLNQLSGVRTFMTSDEPPTNNPEVSTYENDYNAGDVTPEPKTTDRK
jgi:hypothetical protein